jgi:hypothetical protein
LTQENQNETQATLALRGNRDKMIRGGKMIFSSKACRKLLFSAFLSVETIYVLAGVCVLSPTAVKNRKEFLYSENGGTTF